MGGSGVCPNIKAILPGIDKSRFPFSQHRLDQLHQHQLNYKQPHPPIPSTPNYPNNGPWLVSIMGPEVISWAPPTDSMPVIRDNYDGFTQSLSPVSTATVTNPWGVYVPSPRDTGPLLFSYSVICSWPTLVVIQPRLLVGYLLLIYLSPFLIPPIIWVPAWTTIWTMSSNEALICPLLGAR